NRRCKGYDANYAVAGDECHSPSRSEFYGLIVTDAMSMSGLTIYFTQEEASVRAIEAGADQLLKPANPDAAIRGVRDAVKNGRLTEKRIEDSARKLLAAKFDLGLVEQRLTALDE